jgi:hypothetical protein
MTTKTKLLDLLDEIQYDIFFSALDGNGVKHPQLSKLREDFIHSGDNNAAYNKRCKDFVNFYLNENGQLTVISPRFMPYILFALIGIALVSGTYFAFFHNKTDKTTPTATFIEPKNTNTFSGSVKIFTENGQEMPLEWRENTYQTTKSYPSGTKFRLKLSHENSFVYAFATDHTMEISQIYPLVDGISVANTSLAIPTENENDFIQMNSVKGTDVLCLLYAKEKLDFKQIKSELQQSSGDLKQRLEKILGEKISFEADFQRNNLEFSSQTDKSIFAMQVLLSHH